MFVVISLFFTVTVLYVNVYIGSCIATVGDDSNGLAVNRFHGHVDVYVSVIFLINNCKGIGLLCINKDAVKYYTTLLTAYTFISVLLSKYVPNELCYM